MNRIEKDPLQKRIEITNWVLVAALTAGSLVLQSDRFTLGILCGGLISVINFHGLCRNLVNVFTVNLNRARPALMIRYYMRLAVTGLLLYLIISRNIVDVIGLVIGLSVVVLNIMLTTVLLLHKNKHAEEVR